ncbi:MAG: hypothetical protein AB1489_07425 [Acidobacteriota bacterium]
MPKPYRRSFWLVLIMMASLLIPSFNGATAFTIEPNKGKDSTGLPQEEFDFQSEIRVEENEDPDLPSIKYGNMSKRKYLRMRSEHIKLLRGIDEDTLGQQRSQAINEMQQQEELLRSIVPLINSTSWTSIGPAPIPNGQTTSVSTAVSGRVTSIAIHPTNPNIAYVGTAQGGVYRTLNGGTSWTALFDSALSLTVGAIAIAPSSPTTVYVGTGEANFSADSFFGVGVYRINNAETTATLTGPLNKDANNNDVFSGRTISKILVHPTNANTIFVSTASGIGGIGADQALVLPNRGVYRSTNALSAAPVFAKLTVATAAAGNRSVTDMVFEPGNPQNLVCAVLGPNAAGDGGIYRSTNALAATPTFTRTLALGTATAGVRVSLAINKVGSTVTVIAATGEAAGGNCAAAGQSGVLRRSTNGGATWSAPLNGGRGFCGGQCFYDIGVAISPTNANIIYLGGNVNSTCSTLLSRSTNGGSTFTRVNTGLHADTHAIEVAPSNASVVYTGNDGGIWRSTNSGTNWTSLNNSGFNATQFQSMAIHPTDREFMIGGTQDNGTELRNPNGTWRRADFGDGGFSLIDQNATNTTNVTMYHTYFNSTGSLIGFGRVTNVANATDSGWTFLGCQPSSNNGINCNDTVLFYAPMALGPGNPNTLYFGTDRLYRSTNQGSTMTVVSQAPLVAGQAISAIGISRQNGNVRIVGLRNGRVFATTTGSTTLIDVTGPIPARYIARAVIDPNNANTAYVTLAGFGLAAGQHVWKTTNLNAATPTWTAAGNGIPDVPVNAFVVDPANSNNIFAGTDIGVFRSTNGGQSWTPFSNGLPRVAVFDMTLQNANRVLRIATHGRGIWEISVP